MNNRLLFFIDDLHLNYNKPSGDDTTQDCKYRFNLMQFLKLWKEGKDYYDIYEEKLCK